MSFKLLAKIIREVTDREELTQQINQYFKPYLVNENTGDTFLMVAILAENTVAIELLLQQYKILGGDINVPNYFGETALIIAISKNQIETVRQIIAFPCKFEVEALQRHQTLFCAGHRKRFYIQSEEFIDNMQTDFSGISDLSALFRALIEGNAAIIKLLIDGGANIKVSRAGGLITAFTIAAGKDDKASLIMLINAWPGPEAIQPYLEAALRVAAKKGWVELVKFLCTQSIDVHAASHDGYSALMLAALHGHQTIVNLLLPTAPSEHKKNAYVHATKYAIANKSYVILTPFTEQGVIDINSIDQLGNSILMIAINDADTLRKILNKHQKNIQINYQNKQKKGITALMLAVKKIQPQSAAILLQAGADPKLADEEGIDAWTMAKYRSLELYTVFVKHVAGIDAIDRNGNTSLIMAVNKGVLGEVKAITQNEGINIYYKNVDGESAFLLSARAVQLDILQFFIEKFPVNSARDCYDAFFELFYNQTTYPKETLAIQLLKQYVNHPDFNKAHVVQIKQAFIEQALINKQFFLLKELLNLKESDENFDLLPVVAIAITENSTQGLNLLLDALIKQDKPTKIYLDAWRDQAENAKASNGLLTLLTCEDMAGRYLTYLNLLSAENTSPELIEAANPYKQLIVNQIKAKTHITELENAIEKRGMFYVHGLSKFLHTKKIVSWLVDPIFIDKDVFEDNSIAEIKAVIGNKQAQKNTYKTISDL